MLKQFINIVNDFNNTLVYAENPKKAGRQLLSLSGVNKLVDVMENLI